MNNTKFNFVLNGITVAMSEHYGLIRTAAVEWVAAVNRLNLGLNAAVIPNVIVDQSL